MKKTNTIFTESKQHSSSNATIHAKAENKPSIIRVLLVEPMEKPRLVEIEHTLENLQELVGGTIQVVYPWGDPVGLVCDDEGKFKKYVPNRGLVDDEGYMYDIVFGTFFICGLGMEDFTSISDELAERYMERFRWPEMFVRTSDGHAVWMKLNPEKESKVIV